MGLAQARPNYDGRGVNAISLSVSLPQKEGTSVYTSTGLGNRYLSPTLYICSAQFVNLRNFEIAPRKLEISNLRNYL